MTSSEASDFLYKAGLGLRYVQVSQLRPTVLYVLRVSHPKTDNVHFRMTKVIFRVLTYVRVKT